MISLIVAKSDNDVIGSHDGLPWYLPADLRHFKQLTTGHTVVMGRKTFDSIISRLGHPLPERRSIVVTRDVEFTYDDVEVIHDVASIRKLADRVFVIGGGEIYRQTIDHADVLYVTEVHADIDGDVTFPTIDAQVWRETSREPHVRDDKNQYDYDFVTYERR
ncbi:MAG: dihydrofolate reductase [Candidatus Saccharimonadales bacterium]